MSGSGALPELPPIFVISLEASVERRRTVSARLDALGLTYRIVDAVDGRQVDVRTHPAYARLRCRLFIGRDLTAGEFGCLLSHRALYRFMVERRIARAVVLEDDAIVSDDFPAVVAALIRCPVSWDLIRFLAREKVYRDSRDVGRLFGHYCLTSVPGTPAGAYGYALTERAARRLLRVTRKNWLPIDTALGQDWRTGLKAYAVRPSPVLPDDDAASTLEHPRLRTTLRVAGRNAAVYPLTRFAWKLYLAIGKRASDLARWPARILDRRRLRRAEGSAAPH